MTSHGPDADPEIRKAMTAAGELRGEIHRLYERVHNEDLSHALLGLDIVVHALDEVLEHRGLGGTIEHQSDPDAHARARAWLGDVERVHREATALLGTHPNEDLETALKALTVAAGSLDEVAERYE